MFKIQNRHFLDTTLCNFVTFYKYVCVCHLAVFISFPKISLGAKVSKHLHSHTGSFYVNNDLDVCWQNFFSLLCITVFAAVEKCTNTNEMLNLEASAALNVVQRENYCQLTLILNTVPITQTVHSLAVLDVFTTRFFINFLRCHFQV